jgi:hypothetical protein
VFPSEKKEKKKKKEETWTVLDPILTEILILCHSSSLCPTGWLILCHPEFLEGCAVFLGLPSLQHNTQPFTGYLSLSVE